jgi:hypothetical protein
MNIKYISLFLVLGIAGLNATTIDQEFDKRHEEYVQKLKKYNECEKSHPFFGLIACRLEKKEYTLKQTAYEEISNLMKSYFDKKIQRAKNSNAIVDLLYGRAIDNASAAIELADIYAEWGLSLKDPNSRDPMRIRMRGYVFNSRGQGIKTDMKSRLSNQWGDIENAFTWSTAGTFRDAKILPSSLPRSATDKEIKQAITKADKTISKLCDRVVEEK